MIHSLYEGKIYGISNTQLLMFYRTLVATTFYNVSGVVGVNKQKSSEYMVSTCCVYSEAIIVR